MVVAATGVKTDSPQRQDEPTPDKDTHTFEERAAARHLVERSGTVIRKGWGDASDDDLRALTPEQDKKLMTRVSELYADEVNSHGLKNVLAAAEAVYNNEEKGGKDILKSGGEGIFNFSGTGSDFRKALHHELEAATAKAPPPAKQTPVDYLRSQLQEDANREKRFSEALQGGQMAPEFVDATKHDLLAATLMQEKEKFLLSRIQGGEQLSLAQATQEVEKSRELYHKHSSEELEHALSLIGGKEQPAAPAALPAVASGQEKTEQPSTATAPRESASRDDIDRAALLVAEAGQTRNLDYLKDKNDGKLDHDKGSRLTADLQAFAKEWNAANDIKINTDGRLDDKVLAALDATHASKGGKDLATLEAELLHPKPQENKPEDPRQVLNSEIGKMLKSGEEQLTLAEGLAKQAAQHTDNIPVFAAMLKNAQLISEVVRQETELSKEARNPETSPEQILKRLDTIKDELAGFQQPPQEAQGAVAAGALPSASATGKGKWI